MPLLQSLNISIGVPGVRWIDTGMYVSSVETLRVRASGVLIEQDSQPDYVYPEGYYSNGEPHVGYDPDDTLDYDDFPGGVDWYVTNTAPYALSLIVRPVGTVPAADGDNPISDARRVNRDSTFTGLEGRVWLIVNLYDLFPNEITGQFSVTLDRTGEAAIDVGEPSPLRYVPPSILEKKRASEQCWAWMLAIKPKYLPVVPEEIPDVDDDDLVIDEGVLQLTGSLSGVITTKTPQLPSENTMMSVQTAANGKIYILGGSGMGSVRYNIIQQYDPIADTRTTKSAVLPGDRMQMASAVAPDGKIYMFGGSSTFGGRHNTIFSYDPATDTAQTKSAVLPTSLDSATASLAPNGKIYVFGGVTTSGYSSAIYEYNPVSDTIATMAATFPAALHTACSATAPNGKIYILGGANSSVVEQNTIFEFNPVTGVLSLKTATLPVPVKGASCVVIGTKIITFGGASGNTGPSRAYWPSIQEYDTATNTAALKSEVIGMRWGTGAAVAPDSRAFIFGGNSSIGYRTIYQYAVSLTPYLTAPNSQGTNECSLRVNAPSVFAGAFANYKLALTYNSITSYLDGPNGANWAPGEWNRFTWADLNTQLVDDHGAAPERNSVVLRWVPATAGAYENASSTIVRPAGDWDACDGGGETPVLASGWEGHTSWDVPISCPEYVDDLGNVTPAIIYQPNGAQMTNLPVEIKLGTRASDVTLLAPRITEGEAVPSFWLDRTRLEKHFYEGAYWELFEVDPYDPSERLLWQCGHIGNAQLDDLTATIQLTGYDEMANRPVGDILHVLCQVGERPDEEFGTKRCRNEVLQNGPLRADWTVLAVVEAPISYDTLRLSYGGTARSGNPLPVEFAERLANGNVEFHIGANSGLNDGVKLGIKTGAADGAGVVSVVLRQSLPFLPAVGDQLWLVAGCKRTKAACLEYGNLPNMRAQDLPGQNDLVFRTRT